MQSPYMEQLIEAAASDKDNRYFEDYKKEHMQKMSTWKMHNAHARLRGGGGHALQGVSGGGMMHGGGGAGMQLP